MTKTEFIQQACIAMAGNTKFTKTIAGPEILRGSIIYEAEKLARDVEKAAPFDAR